MQKKEFTTAVLNFKHKAFVIHVATFNVNLSDKVYILKKTQIVYLKMDKAHTKVSSKYAEFADVFLLKLAAELLKYTKLNNHAI